MADALFRMTFLLLYAAAWLLVVATLSALYVLVVVARFVWSALPPLVARIRAKRSLRHGSAQGRTLMAPAATLH